MIKILIFINRLDSLELQGIIKLEAQRWSRIRILMSTTISIAAAHTKFFHKILEFICSCFLPLFNVDMWSKSQLQILYEEALPLVLLMVDCRLGMTNNAFTIAQFSE